MGENLDLAAIIVSIIAGLTGWASLRSSKKSEEKNTVTTTRTDMEKEAYIRARAFDTETIERQNKTIAELLVREEEFTKEIASLKAENAALTQSQAQLLSRVERLERAGHERTTDEVRHDDAIGTDHEDPPGQ